MLAPENPAIPRLTSDLRKASVFLSDDEVRYMVDTYYQMQDARLRAHNQARHLAESREPNSLVAWFAEQNGTLETRVKQALAQYVKNHPVGQWLLSITGIGPILAAGFLTHIDITRAPTAGHIWAYAGLDPTKSWGKGEKRPWNASLKLLAYKAGESFVKTKSRDGAFYGRIYDERKRYEQAKNEAGDYADQAARALATKKIGTDTDAYAAYSAGRLPPAHIHARARRYTVKLFLAHLHEVMYRQHYGTMPPLPYALTMAGHAHKIEVPNAELA